MCAWSGQLHPALAGITRWVVGGRSLGARAAVQVAAAEAGAATAAVAAAAAAAAEELD